MIIFQAGDVFAGRFRLEEAIGQGGMGQVWRATQLGLERQVAVKMILPSVGGQETFRALFLREAQISARLSHPNIVPVVDFGEHEGGILWLVQIFVKGADLGGLLGRARTGLPMPLAGYVMTEILHGLQCAHEHGVIHRDLKPGNVLCSEAGNILITDFGIAKVVAPGVTPSVSTVLKGSPGYLAPELLRGLPPTPASDLFSLGGVFFELLTGRNPFIKSAYADRDQIFFSTLNDEVPSLGGTVPGEIERIVRRLLAKDLATRYASAGEVLDDLDRALAPLALEATPRALGKFLSVTRNTLVETVGSSAGPPTPTVTLGSGMAGQMAVSAPAPKLVAKRRGRTAAAVIAATTLVAAIAAAVVVPKLRSARVAATAVVVDAAPPEAETVREARQAADAGVVAPPPVAPDAAPPSRPAPDAAPPSRPPPAPRRSTPRPSREGVLPI